MAYRQRNTKSDWLDIMMTQKKYHKIFLGHTFLFTHYPVFDNLQTEITKSVEKGEILPVDGKMLFINVMSLNVFTFIAYPLLETALGDLMADRERFLAARKAENIEVIMSRILKR